MNYYIKTDADKVVEIYKTTEQIDDKDYIKVSEKNAEILNSGRPLKYVNNGLAVDTEAEEKYLQELQIREEIGFLRERLSATDYVVIKIAEGVATEKEYADVLKDRAEWRKRINEIEGELK